MVDTAREPMTSVDAAWLRMDEPGNLMVINAVMTFEQPLSFERYRELVGDRLLGLPRMRQRVVQSLTARYWEADPDFDIANHVVLAPLDRADQAGLQDMVSRLMSRRLDPRRPPWQFYFVPHYEGGSAAICRFHHCLGDGLALLYVLLSLTDTPPPRQAERLAKPRRGFFARRLLPIVSFARQIEEDVVREAKEIWARPEHALETTRDARITAAAVGKLALMTSDPHTRFKGPLSAEKRAVWSQPIPVPMLKEIARVTGSKINDVALAAVAGGMRRYLLARDGAVGDLNLRAVVPVNLRPIEEASSLGNRFGLVFVPLPIGIADPLDRIFAVRSRMQDIKQSPEALLSFQILRGIGIAPSALFNAIVTLFGSRATAVMSNVVGPREPLPIAGTHIKQVMFWVPCSGRVGMGVSIFSYAGHLSVGIVTDAGLVPDPERIVEGLHIELTLLEDLAEQVKAPVEKPAPAAEAPGVQPVAQPDARAEDIIKGDLVGA